MCAHYESVYDKARLKQHFGVELPSELVCRDARPGYLSTLIRRHPHADIGDDALPEPEALLGSFGLILHRASETKTAHHAYNARCETFAEIPSFRDAWREAQRCIIPLESFFEPDWRSGKAVPTRIGNASGESLYSFTMLTINADNHPMMNQFHKPADEKRMIVVLPPERYDDWLQASFKDRGYFLQAWPAELMTIDQPAAPM